MNVNINKTAVHSTWSGKKREGEMGREGGRERGREGEGEMGRERNTQAYIVGFPPPPLVTYYTRIYMHVPIQYTYYTYADTVYVNRNYL